MSSSRPRVLTVFVEGMLREETYAALRDHIPSQAMATFLSVPYGHASHRSDYHDIIAGEWRWHKGLILVEQDIVVRAGVIEELWECPEPWCGFTYDIAGVEHVECLGCTKFSAQLMGDVPDALIRAGRLEGGCPPKCYHRLDGRIAQVLHAEGYAFHAHKPPVQHLHEY